MKYGINTFLWTANFGRPDLHLLPVIKQRGFDGIEVFISNPQTFDSTLLRRVTEDNGLELTVCSVLNQETNLISDDAAMRQKTRTHMADCIKAVAASGARLLAGPLYAPLGYLPGRRRTADEWKRAVEGIQSLGPVLAETGVTLALEPLNRFETYFLNTAADAAKLCDEINHPSVGVLFDTFHANIEEKDIAQGYRTVAKHLKHVHTCENDRGTPGSGHVEWKAVFAALREIGWDGWLTIESFGAALPEIAAAASIWRDLAPTPEAIAFDGLKFLKQNTAAAAAR